MNKTFMNEYTNKFIWAFALLFSLVAFSSNVSAQVINEILVNPNGGDSNCEYVEIIGTPSGALNNIYFVSIEGDGTSTVGAFDRVVDLSASTLGTNGLLVITNDAAGDCSRTYNTPATTRVQVTGFAMENGTTSWALIQSPTTTIDEGTDYDTPDDGTLDALPIDATILDGLGWTDGGASDVTYGVFLGPTSFGAPDMATRFPGELTPNSTTAWYFGDMDGTNDSVMYDTGQVSGNFPAATGMLTPGAANVGSTVTPVTSRADFDGDGRSDVSVFRGTEGIWYLNQSSDGFGSIRFGAGTDTLVPGDYDGDGKADAAVFRPSDAAGVTDFYILNSSNSTLSGAEWGSTNDIAVPGDVDGDGKSDLIIWRPATATWYAINSNDGSTTIEPFGLPSDFPLLLDNDGDGSDNFATYRLSENTWYVARPTGTPATNFDAFPFGTAGDNLVPGDYDGDGRVDIAMFRPSNGSWYVLDSATLTTTVTPFGTNGDIPVPGDYDGDGTDDQAIYRGGDWWVNASTDGVLTQPFGIPSDIPVPNAYLP